jgi:hypothetical protein
VLIMSPFDCALRVAGWNRLRFIASAMYGSI